MNSPSAPRYIKLSPMVADALWPTDEAGRNLPTLPTALVQTSKEMGGARVVSETRFPLSQSRVELDDGEWALVAAYAGVLPDGRETSLIILCDC